MTFRSRGTTCFTRVRRLGTWLRHINAGSIVVQLCSLITIRLCDENPRVARTRLLETDWRGWAEIALTDLSRAHPDIRRSCGTLGRDALGTRDDPSANRFHVGTGAPRGSEAISIDPFRALRAERCGVV